MASFTGSIRFPNPFKSLLKRLGSIPKIWMADQVDPCSSSWWWINWILGWPRTATLWCYSVGGRPTTWRGCAPSAATTSSPPRSCVRSWRISQRWLPSRDRLTCWALCARPWRSTSEPASPKLSFWCRVPVAEDHPPSRYELGFPCRRWGSWLIKLLDYWSRQDTNCRRTRSWNRTSRCTSSPITSSSSPRPGPIASSSVSYQRSFSFVFVFLTHQDAGGKSP